MQFAVVHLDGLPVSCSARTTFDTSIRRWNEWPRLPRLSSRRSPHREKPSTHGSSRGVFYNQLETVLRDAAFLPGVARTSGTTGPWDVAGSTRIVHLTDGTPCRETVKVATAPDYFAYRLTEFSSPMIGMLVKEANGQWWFTDEGSGTQGEVDLHRREQVLSRDADPLSGHQDSLEPLHEGGDEADQGAGGERSRKGRRDEARVGLRSGRPARAAGDDRRGPRVSRVSILRKSERRSTRIRIVAARAVSSRDRCRCSDRRSATRGGAVLGENKFRQASARSMDSKADLRWGADGKGYRRIIAPNGICVLGTWEITADNPVHRLLQEGLEGADDRPVLVGRQRNQARAAPLDQPRHEDLSDDGSGSSDAVDSGERDRAGRSRRHAHRRTSTTPSSSTRRTCTAYRRGIYILIMLRAGTIFQQLDKVGDSRQLYEVAELGKPPNEPTNAPEHMLLKMAHGPAPDRRATTWISGTRSTATSSNRATRQPTGSMEFDISVSDTGREAGVQGLSRVTVTDWQRIGTIAIHRGDLPPTTPTMSSSSTTPAGATNRNDPSTAIRVGRATRRAEPRT